MFNYKKCIQFLFVFLFVSSCFSAEDYYELQGKRTVAGFERYLDSLPVSDGVVLHEEAKRLLTKHFKSETSKKQKRMVGALTTSHASFDESKVALRNKWAEMYEKDHWPQFDHQNKHAHHIIPQIYGGPNKWWNLWPLTPKQYSDVHCNEDGEGFILFPSACGGRAQVTYQG